MAPNRSESLVFARFFQHTEPDEAATKEKGRPMFREYEAVEIRFAANKNTIHVAPAHEVFKTDKNFATGEVTPITYAMAYNDQYKQFKAGVAQELSGTPLSELPFLTASKRLELKALQIHTAEALAALDGPPLKNLGPGGRELKNQAQAYLDKAAGSVDVVKLAAQVTALQAELAKYKGTGTPAAAEPEAVLDTKSPFADWDDEDIKNWIKESGGAVPRGNAGHATIVKAADDLNAEIAKKKAAA